MHDLVTPLRGVALESFHEHHEENGHADGIQRGHHGHEDPHLFVLARQLVVGARLAALDGVILLEIPARGSQISTREKRAQRLGYGGVEPVEAAQSTPEE